ncbi:MAG: 2-hydroxyacid dehydrogenase [Candidatus Dojkabacteria bacterium]|nr:MAG: 2-hydroxyacid dehydrogenase [Candidatus Dojkabacteria bacterium]
MKFASLDLPYVDKKFFSAIKRLPEISSIFIPKDNPSTWLEAVERGKNAELLTVDIPLKVDRKLIDALPHAQAIFCQAVGFDNIDVAYARKKGVKVYNCAGFNANAVAEFVFALITSLFRHIPAAQAHVRAGGWSYRHFVGRELYGKTIGIVGSGNIAQRIASIARGYGLEVLAHTKHPTKEKQQKMGVDGFITLEKLLARSHILVLAVPLTMETRHLIGKEELQQMRDDAILVNTARNTVVDEYALAEVILEGKIAGAVLDVLLEEPFYSKEASLQIQEMIRLPNVIVTPHIAGISRESSETLGKIFVDNVKNFLKGSDTNCINV